ncbi:MAG: serine/threonine-protein phosphatase [Ruminococcus sp.]|nr:serine/threonine-protein phosphatase [Ruminococcus sp.]
MNYYLYGYTDKGGVRDHNEDALLIDKEVVTEGFYEATCTAPFLTAVCDGVGGENAGELASKLCLQHLSLIDYRANVDMKKELIKIHGKIKRKSVFEENAVNMQTTMCALGVDEEGRALCINVGDSRMYRYVNGTIRQISVDQSYGQYLYEHGQIDSLEELAPEQQNGIISSLGSVNIEPMIAQTPLVNEFGAEPDDMIIITSDGVSDFVSTGEFEIGLAMDLPISEKLTALARLAVMNGSTDNITILGIKPYLDDEELAALTQHEAVAETVNVKQVLYNIDPLDEILTIDVNEIIGKKDKKPARQLEITSQEDIKLETRDLFMQAQASLSKLENMFDTPKRKGKK